MRAAAGGQSRHHCPRSLGEGVMLTQGFLPAKGVGGSVFPPALAVSLVKLYSNRSPGIQILGAATRLSEVLPIHPTVVSKAGRGLLLITVFRS